MAEIPKLDLAWEEINALGGASGSSSYDLGVLKTVSAALEIIEKLGGKDPAPQRHANAKATAIEALAAVDKLWTENAREFRIETGDNSPLGETWAKVRYALEQAKR